MKYKVGIFASLALSGLLSAQVTSAEAASKYNEQNPPNVPYKYALGMDKFQELCSSCHGKWGNGSPQGPPLMHGFYKPSHHGDAAFYRAALKGVFAHHWRFGDMPPVPGATRKDVDKLLPFIRWLQRENGLY
jgi:cytochrome c5